MAGYLQNGPIPVRQGIIIGMKGSRTIAIGQKLAGRSLLDVIQQTLRIRRDDAVQLIRQGKARINAVPCANTDRRMRPGERIELAQPDSVARQAMLPELAREIVIRHIDAEVIVVEKPPGLTTVRHADEAKEMGRRAKKFLPQTLVDLMPMVLSSQKKRVNGRIRAVHRIDKETSGLVVLACTPNAESNLGKQFRAKSTGRRYLALVRGQAADARIESYLVRDRGDGRRGSGAKDEGQLAVTHVRIVERFVDCTLVECELETGRTHQVRIHLGEAGTPLCGERIYDRPLHGRPFPDTSNAKRPLLHAAYLAFDHPATGKQMEWETEMPKDMREIIKRMRKK